MSTQSQDRKVQEARRNLGSLREEAHLGELVSAVDAKDEEPSVNYSFDGVFAAGTRLRSVTASLRLEAGSM